MKLRKNFLNHSKIDIKIIGIQWKVVSLSLNMFIIWVCYHKCHEIYLNHGGSYIDSPDWIKSKRATINPVNKKDNKYFQYAVIVALHYEEIGKNPEIITKIEPFINKYKWEGINFHQKKMIGKNLKK